MADVFTKKKRSEVMSLIKSRGNRDTEQKLIAIFRTHGIKGWRRRQRLFGKPDFVFQKHRLAVFVDGCFWHGCPKHGRKPGTNRDYWLPKLLRNQARDKVVKRTLVKAGWTVLRLWEHELADSSRALERIARALDKTLSRLQSSR